MDHARRLYTDGLTVAEIAPKVGRSQRSVRAWAAKHGWRKHSSPETRLEAAITALTDKPDKSEKDWKDLDRYARNLAQLRRGDAKRQGRVERERAEGEATAPAWFGYQQRFLDDEALLRIVKKSRQVGWTYLAAWEALSDALERGRDKSFMSASFRQTRQINRYVKAFARKHHGLKLRGSEVIRLPNDAEMYFLAANAATAQGFSGDVYFDEFAWLRNAQEIYENAAAIATQRDFRITVFSTPSVHSHYFETLWDPARNTMSWSRHRVTVVDAIEGGNDLIDLGKVLAMFGPRSIRRLFMCETLDDEGSAFTLDEIMACVVDEEEHPEVFQRREGETIWGGLDISRWRDDTSVMLVAVDRSKGHPRFTWRERCLMNRVPLPAQEARVKGLITEWRPEEFTVDQTTIGEHLGDALVDEMSDVTLVRFSPSLKAQLVLNMQDIVRARRLRIPFDQRLIDSFLAIKRKALETEVGYESAGSDEIGHADDFWALCLACYPAWGAGDDDAVMII